VSDVCDVPERLYIAAADGTEACPREGQYGSSINVPAMTDIDDEYQQLVLANQVHDPVAADPVRVATL